MATIEKRGESYKIIVSCGYDLDGKQLRRRMVWKPEPGMTKRQIQKELDRQAVLFEEKCRNGQVLDGNIKFAEFAEKWFTDYAEKQLRATTVAGYHKLMPRINTAIGHIRLDKLQPHHLMEFYNNLTEEGVKQNPTLHMREDWSTLLEEHDLTQSEISRRSGVSVVQISKAAHGGGLYQQNAEKIAAVFNLPVEDIFETAANGRLSSSTVQHYHRLISSILSTAVKWQIIFANPCERVDPPKAERKEARYLDEEQTAQLLEALEDAPAQYRVIITLLLYTGLRRGELFGLEWNDINWDIGLLDVQRSLLYLPRKGMFIDDTKNYTSRRVLKLTDDILNLLRQHRKEQAQQRLNLGDQWVESGRIFIADDGSWMNPETATRWFSHFVVRKGLPQITLHSLRHTNATLLIGAGINVKTVSSHLGHSNIATTGNIYAHAIRSAEAAAAEALENVLKNKRKRA